MNPKRFCRLITSAAIATIVAVTPAAAQEQDDTTEKDVPRFIQRYDQDGDGMVSMEEFPTAEEQFQRLDENDDGRIDAVEAPGRRPKRPSGKMFARFDEDGDGTLSLEEFPGPPEHFEEMDTDGDGALTKEEIRSGLHRHGPCGKRPVSE